MLYPREDREGGSEKWSLSPFIQLLNDNPLAKIEGNSVYYYYNDHLGTPQKMTDKDKNVVWYGEFMPFGEPLSITGTIINNLRFPGQYYDEETGLNYNYFRDYHPVIGRYVEADPIGIQWSRNHLYIYNKNIPLVYADRYGLLSGWVFSGGCASGFLPIGVGGSCCFYSGISTLGEVCSFVTCCFRVGGGPFYAGASLTIGVGGSSGACDCGNNLAGASKGVGMDYGGGISYGGSIGFSGCSISGVGGGGKMGVGVGLSIGIDTCSTKVLGCLNTPKKCKECGQK